MPFLVPHLSLAFQEMSPQIILIWNAAQDHETFPQRSLPREIGGGDLVDSDKQIINYSEYFALAFIFQCLQLLANRLPPPTLCLLNQLLLLWTLILTKALWGLDYDLELAE